MGIAAKSIPQDLKNKLRKAQQKALDKATKHLRANSDAFLIRMPTGTGKTGVIACLSYITNPGSTLILTPWENLREQMHGDLKTNFWADRAFTPPAKTISQAKPKSIGSILAGGGEKVIIMTFSSLTEIRQNDPVNYAALSLGVDLVLVDEGHYEPAIEWGKSVKGLKRPTILLTATPYRNDLKLFRIRDIKECVYEYTHKEAVDDCVIRDVELKEISGADIEESTKAFLKEWKEFKKNTKGVTDPRAIVCCSRKEDVEMAVNTLISEGIKAVGIHERFEKRKKNYFVSQVPDKRMSQDEVWVHQNKLTEGLDDPRFCCVCFLTEIKNDRKLVQQIGRVIRKGATGDNIKSLVLSLSGTGVAESWRAYREFEAKGLIHDANHFVEVVNELLKLQPPVEYFAGKFRRKFNIGVLESDPQVVIPPSVVIRSVEPSFSLSQYIEDCTDAINTSDAVNLGRDMYSPCVRGSDYALWVYASLRNSAALHSASLYEIKLETHCVVMAAGYLLIADTTGTYPTQYLEDATRRLPPAEITKAIDSSYTPTNVAVDSILPYETVFRGAEFRGANILNVATSLTDRLHTCRSARAYNKAADRRYVGVMNGRVRKEVSSQIRKTFALGRFLSWAKALGAELVGTTKGNSLFKRYSQTCVPPATVVPACLSVDLVADQVDLFVASSGGQQNCVIQSLSGSRKSNLGPNGESYFDFVFKSGSTRVMTSTIGCEYLGGGFKFYHQAGTEVNVEWSVDGADQHSLFSDYLNKNQANVLVTLDDGLTVFHGGDFYKVDYKYAEDNLIQLIEVLSAPCKNEKGTEKEIKALRKSGGVKFPKGSLFREIQDGNHGLSFTPELLICDDLGGEVADFIAADFENHKLAFIHAKAGDVNTISASAFHEVVSQAMKNLKFLTKAAPAPKNSKNSWEVSSRWSKTSIPRLLKTNSSYPEGTKLWRKIYEEIINTAEAEMFVVLATTGCCDKNLLTNVIGGSAPKTQETAQLVHLLDGLSGYSRQLGVKLRVFDYR